MRNAKKQKVHNLGNLKCSRAMTLAEVLIALGIIGIVCAMTIPTLMHSTQEQEFKTAYKKAYSVMSQALQKANNDNTITPFSGSGGGIGLAANFQALQAEFVVVKACNTTNLSDCWDTSTSSESFHNEQSSVLSFIDSSGMAWRVRTSDIAGSAPILLVDTNGNKMPNKYGQDRFPFFFSNTFYGTSIISGTPTKIIPDVDRLDNSNYECPSYATHLCYYTSWLYN